MARPDHEGDEAGRCGGCGSRNIAMTGIDCRSLGVCRDCDRVQEVEARDWPETVMCDNCAFRKRSPERADPYRWAEIQELVEKNGPMFHCHKGLPLDPKTGKFSAPDKAHGRVTICAGYLAAHIAHLRRAEKGGAA